jgi:mannose-6-phosphate isomerase-like protein (cupin superfamily)
MTAAPAAGYQHSPRPSYPAGTAIPRAAAARHVWGDPAAGEILDLVYVSGEHIHQLLFEVPAGGQFTHSPDFRTVFGADEVLFLVEGDLVVADPERGQVVRLAPGDSVCFGAGTWHHAFNWGTGPARVLEFFAPPPAAGTSGAYAQRQPYLDVARYGADAVLGALPPGRPWAETGALVVVRPADYTWRLDGDRDRVLTGIIASTPELTAARCEVRGTAWSGWVGYPGDAAGYVLSGHLALRLSGRGRAFDELAPGDGFFVPAGERYQVRGLAPGVSSYLAGFAPTRGTRTGGAAPDPADGGVA